jgi:hypothetical protein
MSPDDLPTNSRSSHIKLEPLADDIITPHDRVVAPNWRVQLTGDDGRPIPNRPGHNCPDCDYDLRALGGRTCPECGREFSITEARYAGLPNNPLAESDWRIMRRDRIIIRICAAVFIVSFFVPFAASKTQPTTLTLMYQAFLATPFLGCCIFWSYLNGRVSAGIALATTTSYTVFMMLVALMFL